MASDFEGKTAIVTGAASGIGAAIARELAAGGANVVVADLVADAADAVASELRETGVEAVSFAVDVADAAQVKAMVDKAVGLFGQLDLAVNNAGIGAAPEPVAEISLESWHRVIDINLNGVFYGLKYEIEAMLKSGGGSIVNMASILGSVGFPGAAAYVSAKHALLGLTRTAAIEYSAQGIRVNAIGPGFISTPLLDKNLDEATMQGLVGMHPIGRLGKPEEVAALTCFLLSGKASFISGSYHLVDGAYTAK